MNCAGSAKSLLVGELVLSELLTGCASSAVDSEVAMNHSALVAGSSSILGFERADDWPLTQGAIAAPVSSSVHTQGNFSLSLSARGFVAVTSRAFPVLSTFAGLIAFDLSLPSQQLDPNWGAVQVYLTCASKGPKSAFSVGS